MPFGSLCIATEKFVIHQKRVSRWPRAVLCGCLVSAWFDELTVTQEGWPTLTRDLLCHPSWETRTFPGVVLGVWGPLGKAAVVPEISDFVCTQV